MKPAAPRPDPAAAIASYVSGVSNLAAGSTALATPDTAATSRWPATGPPPTSSMTRCNDVPIGTSPTASRIVAPVIVHTIVPGDSGVPTDRNQSGPCTRMPGMLAMVSVLLTSVGGATRGGRGAGHVDVRWRDRPVTELVGPVPVRRGESGKRRPPVEHLEHRRLLAVQVLPRSL